MANAGDITVKLTAITAQFEAGMARATKSIDGISSKLSFSMAKQGVQVMTQLFKTIAQHSPEAQLAINRLDDAFGKLIGTMGPGVKLVSDSVLTPFVDLLTQAADKVAYFAAAAGSIAGGGSFADFKANWARDKQRAAAAAEPSFAEMDPTGWKDFAGDKRKARGSTVEKIEFDFDASAVEAMYEALPDLKPAGAGYSRPGGGGVGGRSAYDAGYFARQNAADLALSSEYYSGLGSRVVGQAGMAGRMMNAGMQGAAQAGPMGAAAGIGTELLLNTKEFSDLIDAINPALQDIAAVVGMTLGPAMSALAWQVEWLARIILTVFKGVLKVLDLIPGVDFKDEIKDINKRLRDLGKTIDTTNESARDYNIAGSLDTTMLEQSTARNELGGVTVENVTVVAQDPEALAKALRLRAKLADYVVTGNTSTDPRTSAK